MSVGQDVMLTLVKKIDEVQAPDFPKALRNNLKIKVKLLNVVDDQSINIEAKGSVVSIPFTQIKRANLETDINYNSKHNE
jgi:ribosome maturation factor RimP